MKSNWVTNENVFSAILVYNNLDTKIIRKQQFQPLKMSLILIDSLVLK